MFVLNNWFLNMSGRSFASTRTIVIVALAMTALMALIIAILAFTFTQTKTSTVDYVKVIIFSNIKSYIV